MKKTYGVCVGILAMGLVVLGAPVSHATSRAAAVEAGSESSAASSSSSPTASSPADVNTESAAAPEDQSSPAPATPAQTAAPAAAPAPLPTPSMSGPLATAIPHEIPAGPFGKIEVTGILSGIGLFGNNPQTYLSDTEGHVDLSNAQIFIQKTSGWFQFYLQGGAYNLPVVGVPFLKTIDTVKNVYGPFPVGYAKLVKGNFNVEIGALPTLIGDEYTFTFQNMNIERGLLWNQEPAVSRGIQINDTYKKLTLSFSWNDGFYSDRYTSFSGLAGLCHQWRKHIDLCSQRQRRIVREGRSRRVPDAHLSKQRASLQPDLYVHERGCDHQSLLPVYGRSIESDLIRYRCTHERWRIAG